MCCNERLKAVSIMNKMNARILKYYTSILEPKGFDMMQLSLFDLFNL